MTEQQPPDQDEILGRLRRVEGQIRGIQRMIADHRDCEAIVTQILAARAALDRASLIIVSRHIEECLLDDKHDADPARMKRIVEFLIKMSRGSDTPAPVEP
ncbi:MAG: metal-sensitive transcriptional regulator [Chloroflexi bacterium]|nr:metal-sensitive transcriptional regulator [Chloroflexota bacterium]